MSHFCVLVIGENPEEQLEKYDENIEIPRYVEYTKEELIKKGKKEIEEYKESTYKKYLKNPEKYEKECRNPNHIKYVKEEFPKKLEWTDEQIYQKQILFYEKEDIGENGEVYSTYNPNSKWDWYQIGGRWAGTLKLKKEVDKDKYPDVNFSWGFDNESKKEVLKQPLVDQALKGDIDFSLDEKELAKNRRFWELYIEKQEPITEEDKELIKWEFYKKEYYTERYKDKEDYAKKNTGLITFAVVKDGKWFEKGKMGWFGCSSATPEESKEWDDSYYDTWIKNLPDDTLLTIVDCHI